MNVQYGHVTLCIYSPKYFVFVKSNTITNIRECKLQDGSRNESQPFRVSARHSEIHN